MAEVKVLVAGVHKLTDETTVAIYCTTTLIKSDKNIVVDPGAFVNQGKLINSLKGEGLDPEDIDAVILTHSHIDHTTNITVFKKAKIFLRLICSPDYPGQYQLMEEGVVKRFNILNDPIAKDIKIIDTPGHSIDSITVLVKTANGLAAITGDAIAGEEWANVGKKPNSGMIYSLEKYEESRNRILEIADWIVPGHGEIFKVKK